MYQQNKNKNFHLNLMKIHVKNTKIYSPKSAHKLLGISTTRALKEIDEITCARTVTRLKKKYKRIIQMSYQGKLLYMFSNIKIQ